MTAARIDFTPVWNGIKAWVTELTGLNVADIEWTDWPQKWAGPVQVRLNPTAMPTLNSELIYSDPVDEEGESLGELEATQTSGGLLTVSIAVRSRSQDPAKFALGYALLIQGGLEDTEQTAVLDALCISPVRVLLGPQIGNVEWDGRVEQLVTLDVQFSVTVSQAQGAVDWFDKVQVSSDTRNVDGSLLPDVLQTDDEEIGPPP